MSEQGKFVPELMLKMNTKALWRLCKVLLGIHFTFISVRMNSCKMITIGCDLFIHEVGFFFIRTRSTKVKCRYNDHGVCRPRVLLHFYYISTTSSYLQISCHVDLVAD